MSLSRYLANLLNSSGQVEAAKLAATLDLSSKTLTYPDNSVQSADIASLAASKLSGQVPDANAPSGSVIQVVTATQNQPLSLGVSGWVDVSGLTVTLTPVSTSSKFLVLVTLHYGANSANTGRTFRLDRNGTVIGVGDGSSLGNINSSIGDAASASANQLNSGSLCFLDSPSTTSALTYKVQWANTNNVMYLNRVTGSGISAYASTLSTITVLEIA